VSFYDPVRAPRLYPDPANWCAPPVNNAEAWAERVLGILTALNDPVASWVATSTFWGNFPATSRAAPVPLPRGEA